MIASFHCADCGSPVALPHERAGAVPGRECPGYGAALVLDVSDLHAVLLVATRDGAEHAAAVDLGYQTVARRVLARVATPPRPPRRRCAHAPRASVL